MPLEVPIPDPPTLQDAPNPEEYDDVEVVAETNYRRDELEELLHEGAWADAFRQWQETTQMSEAEFEIAKELDLIDHFDFFWDDFADRVGYHAPGLPEDWRERHIHPDLDSWGTVSSINASLTELGQEVCEVLKDEYIDWEAEFEPPDDLPDFE